jgi:hypothetical protein
VCRVEPRKFLRPEESGAHKLANIGGDGPISSASALQRSHFPSSKSLNGNLTAGPMDSAIDPRLRDDKRFSLREAGSGTTNNNGSGASASRRSFDSPSQLMTSFQTPATRGDSESEPGTGQTYGAPETPLADYQHHDGSTPIDGGLPDGPHDPNDPKRSRACEACRGLKVKCEPDASNPDGPCKRCAKAGRSCVVTQPTRKRQKKTDSRVAELEKKIDALTASLQATRGSTSNNGPPPHSISALLRPQEEQHNPAAQGGSGHSHGMEIQKEWPRPPLPYKESPSTYNASPSAAHISTPASAGIKRKLTDYRDSPTEVVKPASTPTMTAPLPPPIIQQPHPQPQAQAQAQVRPGSGSQDRSIDPIEMGTITSEQANEFFLRYVNLMVHHLPAVPLPPGTSMEEVRRSKPVLFLSIMAAASSEYPSVQRQLSKDVIQVFADRVMIQGDKSLELVQALQVAVAWYYPPEHFEELKFYQLVHVAAVMAIDIGLGRKKANTKNGLVPYTWRDHPFRKKSFPDPTSIESRRAWLVCYFFSTNVSMALHRPNLIRWTSFMADSIEVLEKSSEASPTDKSLCSMIQIHRQAEEVGVQFSMDDPAVFIDITEPKVQYALRGFERDLAKYKETLPKKMASKPPPNRRQCGPIANVK